MYATVYLQQPHSSQITLRMDLGLYVTSHFTYNFPLQGKKKRSEIISREHTHALDLPVSIDPLESDLEAF